MLAHGHHVPNCCARIAACYEGLAHEDGVGTGSGVVDNVLRPSHTRLRHADDVMGQDVHNFVEDRTIHVQSLEVTGIDTDDASPASIARRASSRSWVSTSAVMPSE